MQLSNLFRLESASLKKLSTVLFIGQVTAFVIYYLSTFILVRILNTNDYGVFQQFNLLITTFTPIFGFTLVTSLYYFYPISNELDKKSFVIQTYLLLIVIGIFAATLFILFKNELLLFLNFNELNQVNKWLFLSMSIFLVSTISENIFILEKKVWFILLFAPIEKTVYLVFVIICAINNKNFEGAIFGYFLYVVLKLTLVSTYIYVKYLGNFHIIIKKKNILDQIKYCAPFFGGLLIYTLSQKFDKVLVNQYITSTDYGIYSISFLSVPLLANLISSINNVSIPKYVEMYKNGDIYGMIILYKKIVSTTSAIVIPMVVFFFTFADKVIIVLFTSRFENAIPYYRIFIITFLLLMTSSGLILRASNKTKIIFYTNFAACLVVLIVGFIIIPRYKLLGGIITASVSIITPIILQLAAESRLLKVGLLKMLPYTTIVKISIISIIPLPVFIYLHLLVNNDLLFLLFSFVIYSVLVGIFEYILDIIPYKEKIRQLCKIFF
ncbi:MAG: oligosaccharide flippase family protein [Ignavibacterium sp.]|jgi:O-antigen/teichoic acid export membrane protein|nr:oligosaccharide flippase family protein [Ignavibacterium sp.]